MRAIQKLRDPQCQAIVASISKYATSPLHYISTFLTIFCLPPPLFKDFIGSHLISALLREAHEFEAG